jgi:predicted XRE-type DNA-binding protein
MKARPQANKMNKNTESRVIRGSGNVFADIGFSAGEASELHVKAELIRQILNRIRELGLTQILAGQRLGLSQPDVSKLMNGRVSGYSTDRLIALLNALEVDVEIIVRPRKPGISRKPGMVKVLHAAAA